MIKCDSLALKNLFKSYNVCVHLSSLVNHEQNVAHPAPPSPILVHWYL